MKLLPQIKILLPVIIILSLLPLLSIAPTQAQGPVLPTPTNIGDDRDGGSDGPPAPPGASLSGTVYDYSSGGPAPGITVVLDGGGWQAEAVTDSNGYYRFNGLGSGQAHLNLRLPPGTHPVVFDWPVQLYSGADLQANLGFYWGDTPPLPVLLSTMLKENTLTVQVENQTEEEATGGLVEIQTPPGVRVLPTVQASQGSIAGYDSHQFQVEVGPLPAGGSATIELSLQPVPALAAASASADNIRVIFTYDQQLTPQVVGHDPNQLPMTQSTAAESEAGEAETEESESSAFTPPTDQAETAEEAETATVSPLPDTGASTRATPLPKILLSLAIVLSLGIAGWWSAAARRV